MELLLMLAALTIGFSFGLLTKGITITHKSEQQDAPVEYNPSTAADLPPEIKDYFDQNNGYLK